MSAVLFFFFFFSQSAGELSGVLKDAAMFSVTGAILDSVSSGGNANRVRLHALQNAIRYAHSKGVTHVTDMGDFIAGPRQILKDIQEVVVKNKGEEERLSSSLFAFLLLLLLLSVSF